MSAHADASQSVVDPVPQRRVTSNVTCLACGCLCDDLQVTVEKGSLREAKNACEVGRTWFEWGLSLEPVPTAAVGGRTATLEEALGRATELIANSRAPVVYGLSSSMTETVRDALELAEGLGARVVLSRTAADLGRVAAFQRAGRVSATLGEVKNRADVVVFWGSDPSRTHPRHAERYSIEPSGRFVPLGRAGRSIVVVDAEQTATAGVADLFLPIPPALDVAALVTLRMMIGTRSGGGGRGWDRAFSGRRATRWACHVVERGALRSLFLSESHGGGRSLRVGLGGGLPAGEGVERRDALRFARSGRTRKPYRCRGGHDVAGGIPAGG